MVPFGDKHFCELAKTIYAVLVETQRSEMEKEPISLNKNLMLKIDELEKKRI